MLRRHAPPTRPTLPPLAGLPVPALPEPSADREERLREIEDLRRRQLDAASRLQLLGTFADVPRARAEREEEGRRAD